MFRSPFFSLIALASLIILFNSCERHHPGEIPELQQEHFNPIEEAKGENPHVQPGAPPDAATPANFFPKQKP
jgi:hypothetical protein